MTIATVEESDVRQTTSALDDLVVAPEASGALFGPTTTFWTSRS